MGGGCEGFEVSWVDLDVYRTCPLLGLVSGRRMSSAD